MLSFDAPYNSLFDLLESRCRCCLFPFIFMILKLFVTPVIVLDARRCLLGLFEPFVLAVCSILVLYQGGSFRHLFPVDVLKIQITLNFSHGSHNRPNNFRNKPSRIPSQVERSFIFANFPLVVIFPPRGLPANVNIFFNENIYIYKILI